MASKFKGSDPGEPIVSESPQMQEHAQRKYFILKQKWDAEPSPTV